MNTTLLFAATASILVAAPVAAQTAPADGAPPAEASAAPSAPAAGPPALCTDRPTKSNFACTVPAGMVQLETDLVNWTTTTQSGVRTDVVLYTNPTLKYGLGERTDVEANIAPYETIRTRAGGASSTVGGVGDLYLRLKQQLTGSSAKTQIALLPFVKAPTAGSIIGNGKWEGGLVVPINVTLPKSFTLTFGPEADVLENGDNRGKHAQLVGAVNLSRAFTPKLTAYAELWTAQNYDPAGTTRQYSADTAIAYALTPLVQLDVGGNFGLNRTTPGAQVYVGLSTRF